MCPVWGVWIIENRHCIATLGGQTQGEKISFYLASILTSFCHFSRLVPDLQSLGRDLFRNLFEEETDSSHRASCESERGVVVVWQR